MLRFRLIQPREGVRVGCKGSGDWNFSGGGCVANSYFVRTQGTGMTFKRLNVVKILNMKIVSVVK